MVAARPEPAAFTARTLKVYAAPLVSPVKVWRVFVEDVTHVLPPSLET